MFKPGTSMQPSHWKISNTIFSYSPIRLNFTNLSLISNGNAYKYQNFQNIFYIQKVWAFSHFVSNWGFLFDWWLIHNCFGKQFYQKYVSKVQFWCSTQRHLSGIWIVKFLPTKSSIVISEHSIISETMLLYI